MARRHHTAEGVINKLREAAVGLANALTVPEVCRSCSIGACRSCRDIVADVCIGRGTSAAPADVWVPEYLTTPR